MICLNPGCQRHMGKGLHVCHVQEAARRRWRKVTLPGNQFMSHVGQAVSRGTPKAPYPPQTLCSQRSPPKHCSGRLDWANALLPAGGLWEGPGGIKSNCTTSCGVFFATWGALETVLFACGAGFETCFLSLGALCVLCFCFGSSLLRPSLALARPRVCPASLCPGAAPCLLRLCVPA